MSLKLCRTRALGPQKSVVAIGNFDGVHAGHQKILQKTHEIAQKNNARSVLLTFEPYPQAYFYPEKPIPRITSLREKIKIINNFNLIDRIYLLKFNQILAKYSPEQFITQILIKQLNASHIVIGEDFRFGFNREGNANLLKKFMPTEIILPVFHDNKRVSSTWIREVLQKADFQTAQKLLKREYVMIGRVIEGKKLGRQLGFPTANISLAGRVPPFMGVYAVKINQQFNGVANLGVRPTVDSTKKIFLEVHLLDFQEDLYGKLIEVAFIAKIRAEKKFDSLDALKNQIQQDILEARRLFS